MDQSPSRLHLAAWEILLALVLTVIRLSIGAFDGFTADTGGAVGLVAAQSWDRYAAVPWVAFTLIGAPFLIDVSGNTAGLYDPVDVWDNINHFVNWMLLAGGIGLLIARFDLRPRWMLVLTVTGLGCLLALGREIGEWWTFIRRGSALHGAYEDTLSDELPGTSGVFVAARAVSRHTRARPRQSAR